ncbi:MAG: hypothetical protein IJH34_12110, partial [Romboutsia sp.]|nr:hypothetical protein [Romboutsia sp.]
MKKITILVIVALLLLIFINPSKTGIISTLNASAETAQEIINIDLEGEVKYTKYKELLCFLNNGKLSAINENGKEVFSKEIPVENVNLSSDNYIDVLNKNSNKIYSIDDKGEIIFSSETSKDGFLYKSINEYVFVDVIKSNGKEVIKILNESGWVSKKITIEGKVANVKPLDENILVSYISITDKVYNNLIVYDSNGNLKSQSKLEGIILDILIMNDNVYLVLDNKIIILDKELNTKIQIDLKDIISISNNKDKIFVKDNEGSIGYIKDNEYHNIKTKEK